jgi:hypothetical protein
MRRINEETLGQRLRAWAYWLAFSVVVSLLWVVIPVPAAAASSTTDVDLTSHAFALKHHNNA